MRKKEISRQTISYINKFIHEIRRIYEIRQKKTELC